MKNDILVWHSCKDRRPAESGRYFVTERCRSFIYLDVIDYSSRWDAWNLHDEYEGEGEELPKYTKRFMPGGDSEVIAWADVVPYGTGIYGIGIKKWKPGIYDIVPVKGEDHV